MCIYLLVDVFKAWNNRISSQNRSKSYKILQEKYFGTIGESCAWLYEKETKKTEKADHVMIQTMSRHVVRAWENESAMSFGRSAAKDRSAG